MNIEHAGLPKEIILRITYSDYAGHYVLDTVQRRVDIREEK